MTQVASIPSPQPSAREKMVNDFTDWLSATDRFTAPYGIISGPSKDKKNRSIRSVTFGVARVSDVHLAVYSTGYMILDDSRFGKIKCSSIDEVKAALTEWYRL